MQAATGEYGQAESWNGLVSDKTAIVYTWLDVGSVAGGIGSRQILLTGRLYWPFGVCRVTTRVVPSEPGCSWIILPVGQLIGGVFSSRIIANRPISMLTGGLYHFVRACKVDRYSRCHLFQSNWKIFCVCCHCRSRLNGMSLKSMSGTDFNAAPVRKCPGVNGCKSEGSSESGTMGREFKQHSICANNVSIES